MDELTDFQTEPWKALSSNGGGVSDAAAQRPANSSGNINLNTEKHVGMSGLIMELNSSYLLLQGEGANQFLCLMIGGGPGGIEVGNDIRVHSRRVQGGRRHEDACNGQGFNA